MPWSQRILVQVYKLMARQIAALAWGNDYACLPKPVADINGNGMHTNISIQKKGKNTFITTPKAKMVCRSRDGISSIVF